MEHAQGIYVFMWWLMKLITKLNYPFLLLLPTPIIIIMNYNIIWTMWCNEATVEPRLMDTPQRRTLAL